MLLSYITDRKQLPGTEAQQRERLLEKIAAAARAGVDFIQLREKDLHICELEQLARDAVHAVRNAGMGTRFVVNTRTDVAIATGCDGVHLPTDDLNPSEVKQIFASAGLQAIVGVSCHSVYEVTRAAGARADYAVFGPVFEKTAAPGVPAVGLNALREACEAASVCTPPLPVLAIGGITVANARDCLQAGACGIAAIRLFQQNDTCAVVAQLRAMLA